MTTTSHSYPAYKPSGVAWIGDVPAHWEVRRLRSVADVINGATPSTNVPVLSVGDEATSCGSPQTTWVD